MTQEETISNLKAYLNGDVAVGNIIPLRSVLESAIKYLSEPSLPSDLDEAALKVITGFAPVVVNGEYYYLRKQLFDIFEAGAEWMAGQGETRIVRANADFDPHGADYGIRYLNIRVEDDIPVGTKFIVQIRKKQ